MSGKTVGIIIDPLDTLNLKKDSSLAIMEELQNRGHKIVVFETQDLYAISGKAFGHGRQIQLNLSEQPYYNVLEAKTYDLSDLDLILMRKDPPFDAEYIHTTHILELADTRVCNHPIALRTFNEKASLHLFPTLIPPTLMTKNMQQIETFIKEHGKAVVKPLNQMGGASVFVVDAKDSNRRVIVETVTKQGRESIIVQKFLPEIKDGDQRILIFFGKPIDYKLVRLPSGEDHRGNLAAGADAIVAPLTDHQKDVCEKLAPFFVQHHIDLVGLDMIGDFVTEINITSPTCFREISAMTDLHVAGLFVDGLKL